MFNVFTTPKKEEGIKELVTRAVGENNDLMKIITSLNETIGIEAMKEIEDATADELYARINEQPTYGTAFLLALMNLLHSASVVDNLLENYIQSEDVIDVD